MALGLGIGLATAIGKVASKGIKALKAKKALKSAENAVGGMGIGIADRLIGNKLQRSQNEKLMQQQIEAQKEMGRFNQGLGLEMWDKTNYSEQRKQLEKAGLNVGLLYGMGGAGGATTSTPTGSVGSAIAEGTSGMGIGLMAQRQQAEIDLLKAQTNKTNVEATKTAGVDTEQAIATIAQIKEQTKNVELKNILDTYETKIKDLEVESKTMTFEASIRALTAEYQKIQEEAKQALVKTKVDETTVNETIKQIRNATISSMLDIQASKLGIQMTTQELTKMKYDIMKVVNDINVDNKEVALKKLLAEYQTSDLQKYKLLSEILKNGSSVFGKVGGE